MDATPCSFSLKTIRFIGLASTGGFGLTDEFGPYQIRLSEDRLSIAAKHPERGWIERPLNGHASWCRAYDNEKIDVEVDSSSQGVWKPIKDWNAFLAYLQTL